MKKKSKIINEDNIEDTIEQEMSIIETSIQQQSKSIKEFIEFHKNNHLTSPPNSTIFTLIQLVEKEVEINKTNWNKLLQLFNKYLQSDFNSFAEVLEFCANLTNQLQINEDEKEAFMTTISSQKKKIKLIKKEMNNKNDKLTNSPKIELIDQLKSDLIKLKVENENLKSTNESSNLSQTKKSEKIKKLKNENESLIIQVNSLQRKIDEMAKMQETKESLNKLSESDRLSALESENSRLSSEIQIKDEKIQRKGQKNSKLKAQIEQLSNELISLKIEKASNKNDKDKIMELSSENEELSKKISQFQTENSQLKSEIQKIPAANLEMSSLRSKIEKQKKELNELKSQNRDQIEKQKQREEILNERINSIQNEKHQMNFENAKLKEELKQARLESSQTMSQKGSELDSYIETIKKKQSKIDRLKDELARTKEGSSKEIQEDKNVIQTLKMTNNNLTSEIALLKNTIQSNKETIEKMKDEVTKLKSELLLLNDKMQKSQQDQLEKLEQKGENQREMQEKYEKQIRELQERSKDKLEKKSSSTKKLKNIIHGLNEKVDSLNTEICLLRSSQKDANLNGQLIKDLEDENRRHQSKIQQLRAEIESLRSMNNNFRDLNDQTVGIQNEIRIRDSEILRLTTKNRELEDEIERAKQITAETTVNFRDLSSRMQDQIEKAQVFQCKFGRQKNDISELKSILHDKIQENESLKRQLSRIKSTHLAESSNRLSEVEHQFISRASKIESRAVSEIDLLKDKIRRLKSENERYFCENQRLIEANKKLTKMLTDSSAIARCINTKIPNTRELKKEVRETKKIARIPDHDNEDDFESNANFNALCRCSSSYSSAVLDDSSIRERIGALESEIDSLQSDVTLFS